MVKKKLSFIMDLWREEKKQYVKRSTISAYALLIENHLKPFFGEMEEVKERSIQEYVIIKLNDKLSQKTVKDTLIVLKMVLKFAVKNKMMEYKEVDIKFPTQHINKELEVFNRANQRKIMEYIESNFTFKNLGVYICFCTGLRIGELCALQWSDIDTENGTISVNKTIQRIYIIDQEIKHTELVIDTPKTSNSIREIPMTAELLKIMKLLKKVVNNQYFVLTNSDKPTEPRTYRNYYKKLMKQLDMPNLKFHGLRHSFATRCIEGKCDYKTVSVLLGHSNISTTLNLYVHPNMDQKKKCINQMKRALNLD